MTHELERCLDILEVVSQIWITAAHGQHEVQHCFNVVTTASIMIILNSSRLSVLRENVNSCDLEYVHQLINQGPRESEALVLAGANLLIEHLLINLGISTASAGAICLRKGNENQEVNDKACDDYLDQRRYHEDLCNLHQASDFGQNIIHSVSIEANESTIAFPFEICVHHQLNFEVQRVFCLLFLEAKIGITLLMVKFVADIDVIISFDII